MDLVAELAKIGVVGIFAAIMYKLYIDEKKAHDVTRALLLQALADRLTDSKSTTEKYTTTVEGVTTSVRLLTEKIVKPQGAD